MPSTPQTLPPGGEFLREIYTVFGAYVAGELIESMVYDAVLEAIANAVTGATREEILAVAADVTRLLVERTTETTMVGIAQTLTDALDRQLGVDATARLLRDQIGLSPSQVKSITKYRAELSAAGKSDAEIEKLLEQRRTELIRERAKAIAHTEMRNAVEAGEQSVALKRGNTHQVSISRGDNRVSDICQACEAQGPIPIGSTFASGSAHAPHHPNCRCTTAYVRETGGGESERAAERANVRASNTAAAKSQGEAPE